MESSSLSPKDPHFSRFDCAKLLRSSSPSFPCYRDWKLDFDSDLKPNVLFVSYIRLWDFEVKVEQLHKIFKLCGSPPADSWKKSRLPHATLFKPQQPYESCLWETFKDLPTTSVNLIETLLSVEPYKRATASAALTSGVGSPDYTDSFGMHKSKSILSTSILDCHYTVEQFILFHNKALCM